MKLLMAIKDTEGRTTGDVGFHMKSITVGKRIHLIYDSVNGFDLEKNVTKGEIRYASRSSGLVEDWVFQTLDTPGMEFQLLAMMLRSFNSVKWCYGSLVYRKWGNISKPKSTSHQGCNRID
jgi:hypothetical protein